MSKICALLGPKSLLLQHCLRQMCNTEPKKSACGARPSFEADRWQTCLKQSVLFCWDFGVGKESVYRQKREKFGWFCLIGLMVLMMRLMALFAVDATCMLKTWNALIRRLKDLEAQKSSVEPEECWNWKHAWITTKAYRGRILLNCWSLLRAACWAQGWGPSQRKLIRYRRSTIKSFMQHIPKNEFTLDWVVGKAWKVLLLSPEPICPHYMSQDWGQSCSVTHAHVMESLIRILTSRAKIPTSIVWPWFKLGVLHYIL